tara:strand:- start:210 stop:407 length:198 start_codon:yes stop_codon:yes gene_type:complete
MNYLKTKWTSVKTINGWRHYEVRNVHKKNKKLELFSVCDRNNSIMIDLNDIKDKSKWLPGWKEIV